MFAIIKYHDVVDSFAYPSLGLLAPPFLSLDNKFLVNAHRMMIKSTARALQIYNRTHTTYPDQNSPKDIKLLRTFVQLGTSIPIPSKYEIKYTFPHLTLQA